MLRRDGEPSRRPGTRAERRDRASADTRSADPRGGPRRACSPTATRTSRRVGSPRPPDVPLSQIHYYFGSKQQLILALLAAENERLLDRQRVDVRRPTSRSGQQWERACDFLEADLESGYVRILQEMIAAGWSDPDVAASRPRA